MTVLGVLLLGYGLLGLAYWLWMLLGVCRVVRRVPRLGEVDPPGPPSWPRLSLLIPACNEAPTLELAIASVLDEDYPDLEVLLINDRSTDETGAVIDRVAAADSRVRAVHIRDLPEGWLGKVHALHQGAAAATGAWMLMLDADVHLRRGTLRRAIALAEHEGLDHLAAGPGLWSRSLLSRVAIAAFLRTFCVTMRVWAVADPKSSAFIGVGAFNLVRRAAFDRTEGFAWLSLEVADDVGLGMMLKQSGARSAFVGARGHVAVEWYPSLADMARGTEKAFASVGQCSVGRILAVCVVSSAMELAPWVSILPWGVPGLLPLGAVSLALAVASILLLHTWAGDRPWAGLLYPLAVPVSVFLLLRCAWLGWRRGGVLWRGTLYPSALLRGNLRVRFP